MHLFPPARPPAAQAEPPESWLRSDVALSSPVMPLVRSALVAALAAVACNGPSEMSTSFSGSGVTTPPGDASSGESSSTSSGSSSSSGGSSGSSGDSSASTAGSDATTLDMGTPPDFDPDPPGCKGKIDFLFVISRAGIMGPAQDQLVAAAPDFIATIQAEFDDFDVHIMVVDSEKTWWVEECEFDQCPDSCDIDPTYPCGYWPTECDLALGAGTVFNAGPNAADKPCDLGEHRYITKDTPNIEEAFECIARVGTWGQNKMGDALVAAVSPKFNALEPAPGGCNAGFLRDDALLVLTMIGPEDNPGGGDSEDLPWEDWRQAVVDAKHGDLNAIVALGIIAGDDCLPTPDPDIRLCNLIPSFPNSILEHLTLEDFGDAFDKAAVLALDACSLFVPG